MNNTVIYRKVKVTSAGQLVEKAITNLEERQYFFVAAWERRGSCETVGHLPRHQKLGRQERAKDRERLLQILGQSAAAFWCYCDSVSESSL